LKNTENKQRFFMQTALITGGSNGIGKAICLKLSEMKFTVVNADTANPQESHKGLIYRCCDVTCGEDVDNLFLWMKENTGLPDILIINAGKGIHEKLTEGDPEKWLDVIQTNLMGALRCVRAFVPAMQNKKQGKVIFISSVSADKIYPYGGVYSATKAALEVIAKTVRIETDSSIGITVIRAGITDTGFFKNHPAKTANAIGQGSLQPMDIADEVWHAINKQGAAQIQQITIMPQEQSFF
jgi:NADP-dependent 3-hydroxy acid dehydrogenase YdfG